jgi:hypothetical protein
MSSAIERRSVKLCQPEGIFSSPAEAMLFARQLRAIDAKEGRLCTQVYNDHYRPNPNLLVKSCLLGSLQTLDRGAVAKLG